MKLSSVGSRCCVFFLMIAFGSARTVVCEPSFPPHDLPEEGSVEGDHLKELLGEDVGPVNVLDRLRREVGRQAFVPPEDLVELARVIQPELLDFDRDEVEAQALRFLSDNPATPFRAEIYYHLGAMYGPAKGNLPHSQEKLESYFELASKLYGDRYSKYNRNIKTHLAGLPGKHQERLSFYEWQSSFLYGKRTMNDVFSTRTMASAIKYRLDPTLSDEERSSVLSNFASALPPIMEASENWLVRVSSLSELNDYIQRFPGSSIAAKAELVNQKKKDKILLSLYEETLKSPSFSSDSLVAVDPAGPNLSVGVRQIDSTATSSDRAADIAKNVEVAAWVSKPVVFAIVGGVAVLLASLVARAF